MTVPVGDRVGRWNIPLIILLTTVQKSTSEVSLKESDRTSVEPTLNDLHRLMTRQRTGHCVTEIPSWITIVSFKLWLRYAHWGGIDIVLSSYRLIFMHLYKVPIQHWIRVTSRTCSKLGIPLARWSGRSLPNRRGHNIYRQPISKARMKHGRNYLVVAVTPTGRATIIVSILNEVVHEMGNQTHTVVSLTICYLRARVQWDTFSKLDR